MSTSARGDTNRAAGQMRRDSRPNVGGNGPAVGLEQFDGIDSDVAGGHEARRLAGGIAGIQANTKTPGLMRRPDTTVDTG